MSLPTMLAGLSGELFYRIHMLGQPSRLFLTGLSMIAPFSTDMPPSLKELKGRLNR